MVSARQVVVTGMGVVSPFGRGLRHNWNRLIGGDVAISSLDSDRFAALPSRVGGVIPETSDTCNVNLKECFSSSELRTLSRGTCLAVLAAEDAAREAAWKPVSNQDQISTAVCIGMGMSDLDDIATTSGSLAGRGPRGVSPYFAARILLNMPCGEVARRLGCRGPTHTVSTACATGCHAIGDAFRLIRHGFADRAFCGSVDSGVSPLSVAAFSQMRALSRRYNSTPELASRPFDVDRDGFVLAEGAAVLLLEELDCARRRGANILGEVLGYGMSGDASHPTAPRVDGEGARRAMSLALREANVPTSAVGYVNAHATGTPLGDRVELEAILELLGRGNPLVSSCKGALGHMLGGAGSVESAFTVMSCLHGLAPANANLVNPEPVPGVVCWRNGSSATDSCIPEKTPGVRLVVGSPCPWETLDGRRVALKNSFGFGGTNASLCVANYKE